MKLREIGLLLFILPQIASAELEGVGVAFLAIQRFTPAQCTTALHTFDGIKRPALAFLWGSFGTDLSCVKRFIQQTQGRHGTVLVYAYNDTCDRLARRCTKEDKPKDFTARVKEIRRFVNYASARGVKVIVTVGLEDDLPKREYSRRVAAMRKHLPVPLSRNPFSGAGGTVGVDYYESHRLQRCESALPCVLTNDGYDISLGNGYRTTGDPISISALRSSIKRIKGSYSYVLLWWRSAQGNSRGFVEPRKRTPLVRQIDCSTVNKLLREIQ